MSSGLRNYAIVTTAYFLFTITDGALRMLALLHFYSLGHTPLTLPFMFLLYESDGIFANAGGGWTATRFGIPRMLVAGPNLQIGGTGMLSPLQPTSGVALSVAWVVLAQGLARVAEDLIKTSSKSAIKASSSQDMGQLFRWVAWFTGWTNATKGACFFIGGFLLQVVGIRPALWLMAGMLAIVLVGVMLSEPHTLGKAKSSKSFRELFAKTRAINLMAAAWMFMFGSRDVWFIVGLPVDLCGFDWKYMLVAGFVAVWTIACGAVQAMAPQVVACNHDGLHREVPAARLWGAILL